MDRVVNAVSLNNEGVSKLLDGKYQKAIALLRRSLAEAKGELRALTTARSHSPLQIESLRSPEEKRAHSSALTPPVPVTSGSAGLEASSSACLLHSNLCPLQNLQTVEEGFLYSKALMLQSIPSLGERSLASMERTLNVYCACIIFNLALTYHCISKKMTWSNHQGVDLKKATLMYDLILKLLSRYRNCDRTVGTVNLLLTCTMNNLSHILYFDLGEYHRAKNGLMSVAVLLTASHDFNICADSTTTTRVDGEEHNATPQWLKESDRQGFLWNVCMLRSPTFAGAA